jgi:hypothetical protein
MLPNSGTAASSSTGLAMSQPRPSSPGTASAMVRMSAPIPPATSRPNAMKLATKK